MLGMCAYYNSLKDQKKKMNCTFQSSSQCLKLFKAIQHTNNMVNIRFDMQGMHIMSMDTSKTSLVRLELNADSFEMFHCPVPIMIGLYTNSLVTILQKSKSSKLVWKTDNNLTLTVILVNDDQTTEFLIRAIDIEEDQLDIPAMDDDMALQVEASVLREWMDKMLMVNGDVQFQITNQFFQCSVIGSTVGTITHREPINGKRIESLAKRENVDITLSFQAAKSMLMFSHCGSTCMVGFSNEQPSRLKVNLDNGSYLCLFVAPKIVDEHQ